ncbi:S1 family peptidase [Aeromonas veronii]|uniref:S1 family peptidase n=1 Tax=Aeromonas veronii TaxID=654 RepID=UPI0028DEF915|nr:trypsin-like peptidase domain-containing protein [Aeromonas veronii]
MSKKMSSLSFFSLHLELRKAGRKIGEGTGFLYLHIDSKKIFLITNYHVLTCRDPKDPASLLPGYPDSPDEIIFHTLSKPTFSPQPGSIRIDADTTWLEHSRRSDGVDIVALPIEFLDDSVLFTQDKLDLVEDIDIETGSDLFIVGFPWGFGAGGYFPIWKKGAVASEPLFKPDGIAMFYIDAYTHPGMSGSPVFASTWRDMVTVDRETHEKIKLFQEGNHSATEILNNINLPNLSNVKPKQLFRLVGIYSGRVAVGNKDPNIGIVWQRSLIDELFTNQVVTRHPHPPIEIA